MNFFKSSKIRKWAGYSNEELDQIVRAINEGYLMSFRHSTAIELIRKALGKDYICRHSEPYDLRSEQKKSLFVDIC